MGLISGQAANLFFLRIKNWRLAEVIGFLLILLSVDFFPNLPDASLDSSWANGLTVALTQGGAPGQELLFTYGPLATVLIAYVGPSFGLGLILSLAIAINFSLLLRLSTGRYFLLAAIVIFLIFPTNEILFYTYLAFIPIAVSRIGNCDFYKSIPIILSILLMPVLILSKLSFFPLIAVLILLICCLEISRKNWSKITLYIFLFNMSLLIFWAITGQPLSNITPYLSNLEIIKGYTNAMESDYGLSFLGINIQLLETIIFYGMAAYLLRTFMQATHGRVVGSYVLLSLGAVLAVMIKHSVVRHDLGHSIFAWMPLCVLPLAIPSTTRLPRMAKLVCVVALMSIISSTGGLMIISLARNYAQTQGLDWQVAKRSSTYWQSFLLVVPGQFLSNFSLPLPGLTDRARNITGVAEYIASGGSSLRESKTVAYQKIIDACPIEPVSGSVDIYPTDINCLLAHGMDWRPRPVFQSYSAYTPKLLKINSEYVAGINAPDHLFIDVNPIDDRLPVLEEGSAWACIAQRYRPSGAMQGRFLQLIRTEGECSPAREIGLSTVRFGEIISLSCDQQQTTVSFNFEPTVAGRLVSVFYKTRRLIIEVRTCDDEVHIYRFVPGMAELPMPLSPLVKNSSELRSLLYSDDSPRGLRVKSFAIKEGVSESPISGWSGVYTVRWYQPFEKNYQRNKS